MKGDPFRETSSCSRALHIEAKELTLGRAVTSELLYCVQRCADAPCLTVTTEVLRRGIFVFSCELHWVGPNPCSHQWSWLNVEKTLWGLMGLSRREMRVRAKSNRSVSHRVVTEQI